MSPRHLCPSSFGKRASIFLMTLNTLANTTHSISKTCKVVFSSWQWISQWTPFKTLFWFSQTNAQSFYVKWIITCIRLDLTSGPKLFLNYLSVLWCLRYSDVLSTSVWDLTQQPETSLHSYLHWSWSTMLVPVTLWLLVQVSVISKLLLLWHLYLLFHSCCLLDSLLHHLQSLTG